MTRSPAVRRLPRSARTGLLLPAVSVVSVVLVCLPLVGLLSRVPWSRTGGVLSDRAALDAVGVSLRTSIISTAVVAALGLPLAWVLSSTTGRTSRISRALLTIPVVLPPVVGGVALLAALGRRGLLGGVLEDVFGVSLPFTAGAVVIAQVFVSFPFFVLAVEGAFRRMDRGIVDASRTMGAGPLRSFALVAVPAVRGSLVSGAVLAWARALGEFGASMMFAGSLGGRTRTVPMEVYSLFERDPGAAMVLSVLMVVVAFAVVVAAFPRRSSEETR